MIALIFSEIKRSKKCQQFIEDIFNILGSIDAKFLHYSEYLIILRTLILDQTKNVIQENQRKIMSKVMKNKNFLSALEYKFSYDKKNELQNINERNQEEVFQLNIQIEVVLLLANLSRECALSMQQAKKILSFDYIKNILTNSNTPFIKKKPFLRCFYQIYITKYKKLNEEFDKKQMIDLFNTIVIPDLQIFHKHIEGIVSIDSENCNFYIIYSLFNFK